jgi:hypothetical protein
MMQLRQLRGWLMRLFGLFHRKQREREFAEELESHLALHIEDNLRAGMSPEEARRQALIKLGGVTLTQERYREQGGLPMLETLLQDLRFGVRMLLKQPGFTLIGDGRERVGAAGDYAIVMVNTPRRLALCSQRSAVRHWLQTAGRWLQSLILCLRAVVTMFVCQSVSPKEICPCEKNPPEKIVVVCCSAEHWSHCC